MRDRLRILGAMSLVSCLAALASATTISVELHIKTEGPASQPSLSRTADGSPLLSWIESKADGSYELRACKLGSRKWNDPVTLAKGNDWFVNWADVPQVCGTGDDRLLFGWLQELGEEKYAYGIRFGVAGEDGKSHRDPIWLHDDQSPTEHGFVAFAPVGVDRAWAVWLDGRRFADATTAFGRAVPRTEEMQLRAALLSSTGHKLQEHLLDSRTCECCPTSVVAGDAGVFVAFRDRGTDELRNIAVTKLDGLKFRDPVPVHDDEWIVPGCPVNGPVLALRGDQLAVAWFTAPGDTPRVRFARGDTESLRFGEPLDIDARKALGRVDLELAEDGTAHLIWMSSISKEKAALLWARISPDGKMSTPEAVTTMDAARHSGIPKLSLVDDAAIVAWTEGIAEDASIRCLQLRDSSGR